MPGLRAWWQLCSSQQSQNLHLLCRDPHLRAPQHQTSKNLHAAGVQSFTHSAVSALLLLYMNSLRHRKIQKDLHQGGVCPPGITQICTRLGLTAARGTHPMSCFQLKP